MPTKNTPAKRTTSPARTQEDAELLEQLRHCLATGSKLPTIKRAAGDVAQEISERTLNAETIDDLMKAQNGPAKTESVLDVPLEVTRITWRNSDQPDSKYGVYCELDVVNLSTGEQMAVNAGAEDVIRVMFKLVELDALPFVVKFDRATKQTANGYYPINCKLIGQRDTDGSLPF
jgi:hypothetical protein